MQRPSDQPIDPLESFNRVGDITSAVLPIEGGRRTHSLEIAIANKLMQNEAFIHPITEQDGTIADRLTLYDPVKPQEWHKKVHIDLIHTPEGKRKTRVDMTDHGEGIYEIDRDTGHTTLRTEDGARTLHVFGQSRLERRIQFMKRDF